MSAKDSIEVVEVAPRDGFQSISALLPTDEKIAIIMGLFDAGCRRVEIGSFVSPKAAPQMADMDRIAAAVLERIGEVVASSRASGARSGSLRTRSRKRRRRVPGCSTSPGRSGIMNR